MDSEVHSKQYKMNRSLPKGRLRTPSANVDIQIMNNASSTILTEGPVRLNSKKMKPASDVSQNKATKTCITSHYFKRQRKCKKSKILSDEDGPETQDPVKVMTVVSTAPGRTKQNNCTLSAATTGEYRILGPDFFQCDALELAPRLLGKLLRRDDVILQITEVEAYRQNDTACHGRFGITARTAPVFGPGGHAYVYLCYGLHIMLNVVADKEGIGAAVLIRSCAPISGLESIQRRRGQMTNKPILLSGPGKVGQALGLTTEWSNHPLYTHGGLEVLDGPAPVNILVGPRVGIEYASPEDVKALWRFAIAGSAWISAPRNTLRPL